jgi:hypothetical protein
MATREGTIQGLLRHPFNPSLKWIPVAFGHGYLYGMIQSGAKLPKEERERIEGMLEVQESTKKKRRTGA